MFPLGTALLPHAPLALSVFEPRYQVLLHDVMRGDWEFGVVLIERGREVGGGDARFGVGTVARVVRAVPLGGGRHALEAVGTRRLRVSRWLPDDPYPVAEIEAIEEPPPSEEARTVRGRVEQALRDVLELCARVDPRFALRPPVLGDDPVRASFEIAAAAPLGPLDLQRVLEARGVDERLALLDGVLTDAAALLRLRLGEPPR